MWIRKLYRPCATASEQWLQLCYIGLGCCNHLLIHINAMPMNSSPNLIRCIYMTFVGGRRTICRANMHMYDVSLIARPHPLSRKMVWGHWDSFLVVQCQTIWDQSYSRPHDTRLYAHNGLCTSFRCPFVWELGCEKATCEQRESIKNFALGRDVFVFITDRYPCHKILGIPWKWGPPVPIFTGIMGIPSW